MNENLDRSPIRLERIVIAHVLRYDLHFHPSLVQPLKSHIIKHAPQGRSLRISRTTWRVIHYLCQTHLANEPVSLSDVFLSIGVSKGTAISCLNNLETWGVIVKSCDDSDKRRLNIQFSPPYVQIIFDFICFWAERYKSEIAPFALPTDEPNAMEANVTSPLTTNQLHKILICADKICSQSLGSIHPAGYIRYAADIKEIVTELLADGNRETDQTLKIKR